jgi:hypothetical protein
VAPVPGLTPSLLPRSLRGYPGSRKKSNYGELFFASFDLATPRRRRAACQQGYWAVLSLIITSKVELSYNRHPSGHSLFAIEVLYGSSPAAGLPQPASTKQDESNGSELLLVLACPSAVKREMLCFPWTKDRYSKDCRTSPSLPSRLASSFQKQILDIIVASKLGALRVPYSYKCGKPLRSVVSYVQGVCRIKHVSLPIALLE